MPFFTIVAGVLGFYMRLMERFNVFDPHTGLAARGAFETKLLIVYSAVFIALVLLFSIRVAIKRTSLHGFENAFVTDQIVYPFAFVIIGLVWLGATIKQYIDVSAMRAPPVQELCFLILSALSAISVVLFAVEMYQDPRRKLVYALSIIPSIFMCYWLVMMYRLNASNPVLLAYVYQCLAIIASALAFYFTSGFVYDKPAPARTIFAYFVSTYLCFVTLADGHPLSTTLIFVAIIAINTIYSSKLIKYLRRKEHA